MPNSHQFFFFRAKRCRVRRLLTTAGVAMFSYILPALAYADGDDVEAVSQVARMIRWSGVLTSAFVIAGAWLILKLSHDLVERFSRQFATKRLLIQKLATFFQFIIYVATGIACILLSFRVNAQILALIGGTIAVAVGFAVKDLVASFIAGIMIMVDRPFQVGDRVAFAGQYGDITAIGLRSVRMTTLDDNIVTIPNNKFLDEITSCGNYGALDMQVVMDFYVGVDQDVESGREIIGEAAVTSRYVHLPKPVVVLVNQVIHENYVAVRLRLKAYVLDTQYEKLFETDVNLRVIKALRDAGIDAPAILHRMNDSRTGRPGPSMALVPPIA